MIKLEGYTETMNALVSEAIACSPGSWDKGWLTIECDGVSMLYRLKSESNNDKAVISDALRRLCETLYRVMRNGGDDWRTATIHFYRQEAHWALRAEFGYGQPTAADKPAPWWKFWQ